MFYDNFLALCKQKGEKPTPLVKKLGLSPGNLSKWQNGASVNSDILQKLSIHFGVSIDRLVNGTDDILTSEDEKELLNYYNELDEISKASVLGKAEGLAEAARRQKALAAASIKKAKPKAVKLPEPELEQTDEPEAENETEYEEEYFEIPLAELPASAGTGIYLDSDQTETIKVAANEKTRQTDFAVKVSGDSMEPRYYSGDIVLVRDEPVRIGEIGIFVYEGEGYIKKLGDGCLISLNPKYPNIQIENPDSLFCQGRVISVLRLVKKRR